MPIVAPVPWVPARYFDDDGDPLAGGLLWAYDAGTDTPKATYHDPAGTVQNAHPLVLDDAGYANMYLISGSSYKLRLEDAGGVQLWEVDQVIPPGTGGAFTTSPIVLTAVPGPGPLVAAAAWQPGWRQIGVTARVTQAFGTSGGLTQLAIGDAVQFDRWGYCDVALGSATDASDFLTGDSPWTAQAMDVLVTPIGGAMDGTGQVELTLWYSTIGIAVPPPVIPPPIPSTGGFFMTAPIALPVVPGASPLIVPAAWQPGWRQLGIVATVTTTFEASGGLTELAIGDAVQFDRWGYLARTVGSTTDSTDFLTSESPWTTAPMDVLVTPIGGSFGAAGALTLVLHYLTLE